MPGRRIKRAILIDIHSVKACTPEMIEGYAKVDLLHEHIQAKKKELEKHNSGGGDKDSVLNVALLLSLMFLLLQKRLR